MCGGSSFLSWSHCFCLRLLCHIWNTSRQRQRQTKKIALETNTSKKDPTRQTKNILQDMRTSKKDPARGQDIQKRSHKRRRHTKKILQETRMHKKDPERLTKNPASDNEKFPNETRTKIPKDTQKDPARDKDVHQISRKRQGHT